MEETVPQDARHAAGVAPWLTHHTEERLPHTTTIWTNMARPPLSEKLCVLLRVVAALFINAIFEADVTRSIVITEIDGVRVDSPR